jgi:hypothetical protein
MATIRTDPGWCWKVLSSNASLASGVPGNPRRSLFIFRHPCHIGATGQQGFDSQTGYPVVSAQIAVGEAAR